MGWPVAPRGSVDAVHRRVDGAACAAGHDALLVEPDGTLWMATALGLSRRTPEPTGRTMTRAGIKHLALDAQGTLCWA